MYPASLKGETNNILYSMHVHTAKRSEVRTHLANKLMNLIISLNNEFTRTQHTTLHSTAQQHWMQTTKRTWYCVGFDRNLGQHTKPNDFILKRCSFGFKHNCHRCFRKRSVHSVSVQLYTVNASVDGSVMWYWPQWKQWRWWWRVRLFQFYQFQFPTT